MRALHRGRWTLVTLLCATLVGCHRPARAPTVLRIAHESDVMSLDPSAQSESVTQSVLSSICEPLAGYDRDMQLRPVLAVNWTNPDENTWMVQLRPDVFFHDGRPLTAGDVRYSLDRARLDESSGIRGHLSAIDEVQVVDDRTVRLHTHGPEPLLMTELAYVLIVPASRRYDTSTLVGTGPYRLVSWTKGRALEVAAFDQYWGGRPAVDRVQFMTVDSGARALDVLRTHDVDVLRWMPDTLAEQARQLKDVHVVAREGLTTYYLFMNTLPAAKGAHPLSDRRVRQAMSLALDRRAIVGAMGGNAIPARQLVPQVVFGYVASLPELAHDPAAARALLKQSGFPSGIELTLAHREQEPLGTVAALVASMMGDVGIRVTPRTAPWPEIVRGWTNATLPLFLAAWRFEEGDAAGFLRDCLFTRTPARGWGGSNAGYSNPQLDALIGENMRIFQETRRLGQYERLMRVAVDEMPLIPLYHRRNLYGVSKRVRWTPRLDGKLLPAEMTVGE